MAGADIVAVELIRVCSEVSDPQTRLWWLSEISTWVLRYAPSCWESIAESRLQLLEIEERDPVSKLGALAAEAATIDQTLRLGWVQRTRAVLARHLPRTDAEECGFVQALARCAAALEVPNPDHAARIVSEALERTAAIESAPDRSRALEAVLPLAGPDVWCAREAGLLPYDRVTALARLAARPTEPKARYALLFEAMEVAYSLPESSPMSFDSRLWASAWVWDAIVRLEAPDRLVKAFLERMDELDNDGCRQQLFFRCCHGLSAAGGDRAEELCSALSFRLASFGDGLRRWATLGLVLARGRLGDVDEVEAGFETWLTATERDPRAIVECSGLSTADVLLGLALELLEGAGVPRSERVAIARRARDSVRLAANRDRRFEQLAQAMGELAIREQADEHPTPGDGHAFASALRSQRWDQVVALLREAHAADAWPYISSVAEVGRTGALPAHR